MNTRPAVILIVVVSLAVIVAGGMLGTFLLIEGQADPSNIALFSSLTGTALGGLMSLLVNTRSQTPPNETGNPTP